ncbi:hypothetical protein ACHAXA_000475 [Cyclostephanos tholiformis]|uniref:SAM-dependent MTase RsmB/NOP-type domain-containing protein n=1 Tax=Cyclostephanos tholiformis TaxID=382380 RepID=A0ABD3RI02_9STRA
MKHTAYNIPIIMSTQSYHARPSQSHRFVRLNPRFDRDETLELLKSELQRLPQHTIEYPLPVAWLNFKELQLDFFAIPGEFCLNRSASFQSGRIYGMDVTSGAAVAALLFNFYDVADHVTPSDQKGKRTLLSGEPLRVLDLCCAPGIKLCMMADLCPASSHLVGVDVSVNRISLCKNILIKYHIDGCTSTSQSTSVIVDATDYSNASSITPSCVSIRLYCADGTTFGTNESNSNGNHGLIFDSNAAMEEFQSRGKRKRSNKSSKAREKRRLLKLQQSEENENTNAKTVGDNLNDESTQTISKSIRDPKNDDDSRCTLALPQFDRVLVDAECSTDGAIRHIEKKQSSPISRNPFWNEGNMDELIDLQIRLIHSGFRLLKRGGVMVYSTCSLSSKQNEQVVSSLLNNCQDSFLIPVSFATHENSSHKIPFIEEGTLPGTVRFNPIVVHDPDEMHYSVDCLLPGSGFFLAKIGKRQNC